MLFRRPFLLAVLAACLSLSISAQALEEVSCRIERGLLFVEVKTPETRQPLRFLLDSGAGPSILDRAIAQELRLPMRRGQDVLSVTGPVEAWEVHGFAGHVGAVPAPSTLVALDLLHISEACGMRVHGILGLDFFSQHIVQIDYARQAVRFFDRAEFSSTERPLDLVRRNDALCLHTRVNGAWRLLRVDTGCNSPLQTVSTRESGRGRRGASVAAAPDSPRTTFTHVQLGSHRFADVKTGVHRNRIFPGEDGLLGNGLLSRFTVTIDAAARKLFLEPGEGNGS